MLVPTLSLVVLALRAPSRHRCARSKEPAWLRDEIISLGVVPRGRVITGMDRVGQLAAAHSPTRGLSLSGALVSSVMGRERWTGH
jgi:hypothetical protein